MNHKNKEKEKIDQLQRDIHNTILALVRKTLGEKAKPMYLFKGIIITSDGLHVISFGNGNPKRTEDILEGTKKYQKGEMKGLFQIIMGLAGIAEDLGMPKEEIDKILKEIGDIK